MNLTQSISVLKLYHARDRYKMMQSLTEQFQDAEPTIRVAKSIRQWISNKELHLGDSLPAVRAISDRLSVSPGTVVRAIAVLKKDGIVERRGRRIHVIASGEHGVAASAVGMMSKTIAIVSPYQEQRVPGHHMTGWSDAIMPEVIAAIRSYGRHVVFIHSQALHTDGIDELIDARPSGLAFLFQYADRELIHAAKKLGELQFPVVTNWDDPDLSQVDRVLSDQEQGAYELTRWLIASGRRRIQMIWNHNEDVWWKSARRAGYVRATQEAGLEVLPAISKVNMAGSELQPGQAAFEASWRMDMSYLLPLVNGSRTPIDAIMANTDGDVFPLAAALRALGKEPNRDVLLAGYDNYANDSWEREFEPACPVCSIDKRLDLIARKMVDLLINRISTRDHSVARVEKISPNLIVRQN